MMHGRRFERTIWYTASVLSRSHVMKDARKSLGGGATWPGECFLKHALTSWLHCEPGSTRVVSFVGWKRYGVSLPTASNCS